MVMNLSRVRSECGVCERVSVGECVSVCECECVWVRVLKQTTEKQKQKLFLLQKIVQGCFS